ncbi:MAG: ABC transporter permease [Desulfamplus sp.]|nr:ABC transporter permease [Desulfamplus sp.]
METIFYYTIRAFQDMISNRFMTLMTLMTISLCTIIMAASLLFYENGARLIRFWYGGIHIVIYVDSQASLADIESIKEKINKIGGINGISYVSKAEALEDIKASFPSSTRYLDDLRENPLPHAFVLAVSEKFDRDMLNSHNISTLPHVESIEYGESWIQGIEAILDLFRLSGAVIGTLFFIAVIFVTGNAVSISLYVRREEFVIMRLVGATERFMTLPFYIISVIQGVLGALLGIGILGFLYSIMISLMEQGETGSPLPDFSIFAIELEFLSLHALALIPLTAALLCWIGCFFALGHFLKKN